jgi:hypothetical protein
VTDSSDLGTDHSNGIIGRQSPERSRVLLFSSSISRPDTRRFVWAASASCALSSGRHSPTFAERTGFSLRLPCPCHLLVLVLWGTLSGSLLPFLLKRLGFDPAASSAPFVATLVDVTGPVIYFSVGLVVLRGTLL